MGDDRFSTNSADDEPDQSTGAQGASRARVRDFWQGGRDHYSVDARIGEQLLTVAPWLAEVAGLNAALLRCAIIAASDCGVRQFLHLDCGMPTQPTTRELLDQACPDAAVYYVDSDPVVLAHARALLRDPRSAVAEGTAEDMEAVLQRLQQDQHDRPLDLTEPVAVLAFDVLEHLDDEAVVRAFDILRNSLAAGSVVAFTHLVPGDSDQEAAEVAAGESLYRQLLGPLRLRGGGQLLELVKGWDLIPPGLVAPNQWPELTAAHPPLPAAGVLRLPRSHGPRPCRRSGAAGEP